ncbi:MAG: Fur family transcriptional regulator [Anaerolineales bacterium]|jgi:Fur family ferric uptake transcriptional regulator
MSCGKRLAEQLRERGYRVTAQRTIILETIAHMDDHISAQQVHEGASDRLPGLNLATVYRTVESLQGAGILNMLSAGGEPMRFSLCDPEHPHSHLVCRECGSIFEVETEEIEAFARRVEKETSFRIDSEHLTLEGLCQICKQNPTAS